jgi:hypothetical protein
MVALVPVALLLGLILGWTAHRRLSLDYKRRWLHSMALLQDKSLGDDVDQPALAAPAPPAGPAPAPVSAPRLPPREAIPYVSGKWALWEKADGSTVTYRAVRHGFDPVDLGHTKSYQRFNALYRRDREQAQDAVDALNAQRP